MKIPLEVDRAVGAMRVARSSILEEFTRKNVMGTTCSEGCHHCCYWPVAISVLEGAEIYLHLKAQHRWTTSLAARLDQAATAVTGLSYPVWLHSETPCVFLEKGRCSIYAARPTACRSAISKGDPLDCNVHRLIQAQSLVPRVSVMTRFHQEEQAILKQFKGDWHTMPIPTAVLVAHRICSGEFNLSQARAAVFVEHLGRM